MSFDVGAVGVWARRLGTVQSLLKREDEEREVERKPAWRRFVEIFRGADVSDPEAGGAWGVCGAAGGVGGFYIMAGLMLVYSINMPQMDDLARYGPSTTTELYDIHGKVFGSFALLDAFEQAPEGLRAEQARRTATEEDRTDFTAIHRVQVLIKIGQQRVDVFLFWQHRAGGVRVEIAIRTFAHTPRNVDVQRQRRQRGKRPRGEEAAPPMISDDAGGCRYSRPRRWRSRSIARARWLIWFLSAGLSSALDTSRSGTQNSGS